jgi:hypothetical protein
MTCLQPVARAATPAGIGLQPDSCIPSAARRYPRPFTHAERREALYLQAPVRSWLPVPVGLHYLDRITFLWAGFPLTIFIAWRKLVCRPPLVQAPRTGYSAPILTSSQPAASKTAQHMPAQCHPCSFTHAETRPPTCLQPAARAATPVAIYLYAPVCNPSLAPHHLQDVAHTRSPTACCLCTYRCRLMPSVAPCCPRPHASIHVIAGRHPRELVPAY